MRYPDDIFLVSYPKSGSTWARFLIANYLSGNQCDVQSVACYVPDLHGTTPIDPGMPRPRLIRSHSPYEAGYRRVIYIARDGRDVAVSYYLHALRHRRIPVDTPFAAFLEQFHAGRLDDCRRWGDHVLSWLDGACDAFLLVRHESLEADPARCLTKMLDFTGIDADVARVESAVEASIVERMQAIDRAQRNEIEQWANTNPDLPFVRRGAAGDSSTYFTPELHDAFEREHGAALTRLGYRQLARAS